MSKRSMMLTAVAAAGLVAGSIAGVTAQSEPSEDVTPEPAAESTAPSSELAMLLAPPDVDGVEWAEISVRSGAEIEADTDEREQAEWSALLDGTGATYERASQLNAEPMDPETGEAIGIYSAIRIADADESQLREALLGVLRASDEAETFVFEEAEIGGKDVTVVTLDTDDQQATVYVSGDTAHLLDLPEEQLALVLASLP